MAGTYDPEIHGFVNFRAAEVRADLVAAGREDPYVHEELALLDQA